MKLAMSQFGFVIPHITKVGEIEEWGDDDTPYSFLVLAGSTIDRVFAQSKEDAEEKRKNLVREINQYYGEPLDV